MKSISKFFGILGVVALLSTAGCSDPCADVDCGLNGTCVEGTCECNDGYEGTNCETRMTSRYVGTYALSETCTGGTYNYAVTVTEGTGTGNVLKITFNPLYLSGILITADVDMTNPNAFTIPSQTVSGITFSGNGTRNGTTGDVSITYGANDGTNTDNCTAALDRQ